MQKRFLSSVIAAVMTAVIFLGNLSAPRAEALLFTPNVTVQSEAAVLLNMEVGDIVYEKNADMKKIRKNSEICGFRADCVRNAAAYVP